MKEGQKALLRIFKGAFMGDLVWDANNDRKMHSKKVKSESEACHCLLSNNTWFGFFQRDGAKICVTHKMSFWGVLEGWAKSDSWVILEKPQKKALGKLKQSESRI